LSAWFAAREVEGDDESSDTVWDWVVSGCCDFDWSEDYGFWC
jgi:hypothetical protein